MFKKMFKKKKKCTTYIKSFAPIYQYKKKEFLYI